MTDRVDVEFLILADWAQVLGGKLYLQGGGWDTLTVGSAFPHKRNLGIAAGFTVPWAATNQKANIALEVKDDDTQSSLFKLEGQLEAGRPPGIPPGIDQLVLMALNNVAEFESSGSHVIVVTIDGEERRRKAFRVVQASQGSVRLP